MRTLDQSRPDPIYELRALKLNANMLHLGESHFRPAVEINFSSFVRNLWRITGCAETEVEKFISFLSSGSIIATRRRRIWSVHIPKERGSGCQARLADFHLPPLRTCRGCYST